MFGSRSPSPSFSGDEPPRRASAGSVKSLQSPDLSRRLSTASSWGGRDTSQRDHILVAVRFRPIRWGWQLYH